MNQDAQRIEMTIDQARAKIKKMEDVDTLLKDKLFNELITEGYLGDDAVRITMNLKPGKDNDTSYSMLNAKSIFSRYIANIIHEGEVAIQALQENQDALLEVEAEDA